MFVKGSYMKTVSKIMKAVVCLEKYFIGAALALATIRPSDEEE